MRKSEKQINRAKEIAKALEEAKSKDSTKRKRSSQYSRVRALRRGDSTPTFAEIPDTQIPEDQDL